MELYNRLQHLIDYVKNHTDAQQPDLMLGIYICEGDCKNWKHQKFVYKKFRDTVVLNNVNILLNFTLYNVINCKK